MRTRSPGCSGCGPADELLVEVGAVRRAEVLEHDDRRPGARGARGGRRRTGPRGGSRPGRRGRAPRPRRCRTPCRRVCPGARSTTSRGVGASCDTGASRRGAARSRRRAAPAGRRPSPCGRSVRAQVAQRAARRPRAGTGTGRPGSRTAARRRRARASASLDLEARRRRCPSSRRSPAQRRGARRGDGAAVDAHAVGRAEVVDASSRRGRRAGARRAARDVGVGEDDVALAAAADHRAVGADGMRLPSATRIARPRRAAARDLRAAPPGRAAAVEKTIVWPWPACSHGGAAAAAAARRGARRAAPGCRTRPGPGARRCGTRSAGGRPAPGARGARARAGRPTARR